MNKFIREQLNKIVAKTSKWDDDSLVITIYNQTINSRTNEFSIGNKYIIRVEDYILNEPSNFTLSSNWNCNTTPPEKELFAICLQIMGNMLKFKCKGKITGIEWEGWLPKKSITIL